MKASEIRSRSTVVILFVILSALFSFCACGGGGSDGNGSNNSSPVAQITTPTEGSIFTVGAEIQFVGSCNDIEDGVLNGASLLWSSDVDGQIGTGETCSSSTLSAGPHDITLTCKDTDGAPGMDTVAITLILDSVWKFISHIGCDGNIWDPEAENFEAYVKIDNGFSYTYICSDGVCYYCTTNDWEEDITNEDFTAVGDTMTHSFYEDDDDNIATPDCLVRDVFERASELDIDGSVEDCIIYGDLE